MPGPHYPNYYPQPNDGVLGPPGSPDLRPSAAPAQYYMEKFDQQYGRHLAGVGQVQDEGAEPAFASNELEYMAEMDDIQGNGVFDQPGARPNIHPDAGIFAARYSLPGYSARERPFSMSEVRDVTTGRRIRVVPSGAVAMDSAAQIAFLEQGRYAPPRPIIDDVTAQSTPDVDTSMVMQNPQPIGQMPASTKKVLVTTLGVGLALGALYAFSKKRK